MANIQEIDCLPQVEVPSSGIISVYSNLWNENPTESEKDKPSYKKSIDLYG